MQLAAQISPQVIALHLSNLEGDAAEDEASRVKQEWAQRVEQPAVAAGIPVPKLVFVQTPYREFCQPLLKEIDTIKSQCPDQLVAVIIPELVERNWLHSLLHTHKAMSLRRALQKRDDLRVIVIDLPWFVDLPNPPPPPPTDKI
jgi:hypothetical protein